MVEFCPECGNLLRKKTCECGYGKPKALPQNGVSNYVIQIWDPPSPKTIYCKLTASSHDKLNSLLNKGMVPEKLKEVRRKLKNHLFFCNNCLYYHADKFLCKYKSKYVTLESICRSFEPLPDI